jgi:hypothetical protein
LQSKTYPRVALNNHRLRQAGRAAVSDGAEVLGTGRQAAEREADLIRARAGFAFLGLALDLDRPGSAAIFNRPVRKADRAIEYVPDVAGPRGPITPIYFAGRTSTCMKLSWALMLWMRICVPVFG